MSTFRKLCSFFIALSFFSGCIHSQIVEGQKANDPQGRIVELISILFPGLSVVKTSDLNLVTQAYLQSAMKNQSPGFTCGFFDVKDRHDCAILLFDRQTPKKGARLLVLMKNIDSKSPTTEILEDYRQDIDRSNIYLAEHSQASIAQILKIKKEKAQPSGGGFERITFEQSSVLYFWENGKIKKVWTSD